MGYCLDQDGRKAILSTPPADAEAFVDAVIIAEGRHLLAVDKEERRPMLDIVTKWAVYQDSAG